MSNHLSWHPWADLAPVLPLLQVPVPGPQASGSYHPGSLRPFPTEEETVGDEDIYSGLSDQIE